MWLRRRASRDFYHRYVLAQMESDWSGRMDALLSLMREDATAYVEASREYRRRFR